MKKQGVVLIAIGNQGYAEMAANLAFSIKRFNDSINITLFTDEYYEHLLHEDRWVFDDVKRLSIDQYTDNGRLDPGKIKVNLYDLLPYKENLYLDVDALALTDLKPLLDDLSNDGRHIITEKMGEGDHNTQDIEYCVWSKPCDIAKNFKVPKKNSIVTIQSSWFYVKRGTQAREFYAKVKRAYENGYPSDDLLETWGGGLPDELFFTGIISQMGLDVSFRKDVMFFGDGAKRITTTEVESNYSLLSLFGNGDGRTKTALVYWEMYDTLLHKWARLERDEGRMKRHNYKGQKIRKFKYANKK